MALWNLAEIRQKVRQVTGRISMQEMSNEVLDNYINKYFQYTFPAEVKLERFHTFYELITLANQQSYDYPTGYINFEAPATVDRMSMDWYQDYARFYYDCPQNIARQTVGTGDGVTVAFVSTATGFPILPGTTIVTDGVEVFQDTSSAYTTSNINIVGSLGGSCVLNLSTGVMSVTFVTAPVDGVNIYFSYSQFVAGRPTAVLSYNHQFLFYPVPDQSYRFQVAAYANALVTTQAGVTATEFTNATDRPLLDQWGPCIAYGTSRDIHADYGEMDAYSEISALYKEQVAYVLRRTNQNLLNMRATPKF